ncbi:two-component system activity regulator YycH [Caldanaerobacter sp.]|uniref:two-component system activity regulator YycH n=1 Tax=Caldanaerobacter sp. TaxID=2930036 RepID=UPI003C71471A
MREKIKTLVLLFLVGVSVYMTYILWISFPQKEISFESKKSTNREVDIFRIIRPQYAFLIENGKSYLIAPEEIWGKIWELLHKEREIKFALEDKKDSSISNSFEGIKLVIDGGWGKEVLKQIFVKDNLAKRFEANVRINRILVDFNKSQIVFEDVYNGKTYSFFYDDLTNLKSISDHSITVFDSVYDMPFTALSMPNIYNKALLKDLDQALLDKIFANISIVRKITENNGMTVYTDGIKSLKVFENGIIEFYSTSPESFPEGKTDLEKAVYFLERLGFDWRNFYLTDVKVENGQFYFFFNYSYEYPIWFDKRDFSPIEVTVSNGGVKAAKILYFELEEKGKINFPREKIRNLVSLETNFSKTKGSLVGVKIGYVYTNGHFIPSAKMEFKKGSIFVNMFNGKLISIGD